MCAIRKFVFEDFDFDDPRLPAALCRSHANLLYEYEKGNYKRTFEAQDLITYSGYITRQSCETGKCKICNVARSNPLDSRVAGETALILKRKPGSPAENHEERSETPTAKKLCTHCFSSVGRGLPHSCTRGNRIDNALILLTPKSKEQVCSAVLKDKADKQDEKVLKFATRGKKLKESA